MASFFKSMWFKCVAVLLVIAVVLGGTLAVLNDLLYVSPKERTDRAIKKIYGTIPEYNVELDIDSKVEDVNKNAIGYNFDSDDEYEGYINKIYTIGDLTGEHDTLFQAVGYEGYKGGSITVWVKVKHTVDGKFKIEKVLLQSYDKQTLMSKLDGSYYNRFLVDVTDAYKNGENFTTNSGAGKFTNPVSGATYSATAGNNAVNCVIAYVGGVK